MTARSYCVGTWACPRCGVYGQVNSRDVEGTTLAAHMRVVHPDEDET